MYLNPPSLYVYHVHYTPTNDMSQVLDPCGVYHTITISNTERGVR